MLSIFSFFIQRFEFTCPCKKYVLEESFYIPLSFSSEDNLYNNNFKMENAFRECAGSILKCCLIVNMNRRSCKPYMIVTLAIPIFERGKQSNFSFTKISTMIQNRITYPTLWLRSCLAASLLVNDETDPCFFKSLAALSRATSLSAIFPS